MASTTAILPRVAAAVVIDETPAAIDQQATEIAPPSRRHADRRAAGVFHGRPVFATIHAIGNATERYGDEIAPSSVPAVCRWLTSLFAAAESRRGAFSSVEQRVVFGEVRTTYALERVRGGSRVRVVLQRTAEAWLVLTILPREGCGA